MRQAAPGKDGDFPRHIRAGEVITGVRLGEAVVLGLSDDAGEGAVGGERIEDVGEGPAEDALDAGDAVPRVYQVL